MKQKSQVIITEKELEEIIKKAVGDETGCTVKELIFQTSVRGDYDKGDAKEYVKQVICITKP